MDFVNRIRRRLGRLPLAVKLTGAIAVATAMVLFLLLTFLFMRSTGLIRGTADATNRALLNSMLGNLDDYHESLLAYSCAFCESNSVASYIQSPALDRPQADNGIRELLQSIYRSRRDIRSYTVYFLQAGRAYRAGQLGVEVFALPEEAQIPNYEEALRLDPQPYLAPITDGLYTITRIVTSPEDGRPAAMVAVEVSSAYLSSYQKNDPAQIGELCLFDAHNQLFFSSNHALLSNSDLADISPVLVKALAGESPVTQLNGRLYVLIAGHSPRYGWRLVRFIPLSHMEEKTGQLLRELALLACVMAAVKLLIIYLCSRRLTRPLYALSSRVLNPQKTAVADPVGGSAEILMLSQRFDELAAQVAHLKQQNKQILRERDSATLTALEAQVTPGLISHTLSSFLALAQRRGHNRLMLIVNSMLKLLEYTASSDDFERVGSEVRFTSEFLSVLKNQALDRFDFSVDATPDALDLRIPKLFLYPLAENALLRARDSGASDIRIDLHIRAQGALICILASDNAPVPTPAQQEEMRRRIDAPGSGIGTGSGFTNLLSRLKLMYGDEFSVALDISDGVTSITVCIPAK